MRQPSTSCSDHLEVLGADLNLVVVLVSFTVLHELSGKVYCDTLARLGHALFVLGAQYDAILMDFILCVVLFEDDNVENCSGNCVNQHYLSTILGHRNTIWIIRGVISWNC